MAALAATLGLSGFAAAGLQQHIEVRFDPPIDIPDFDGGGVTFNVPVSTPPHLMISRLSVGLVVEHAWQGDVSVFLDHTDTGIGGFLVDRPGTPMWGGSSDLGYDADNFGDPATNTPMMLDDLAELPIDLYAGPISGPGTGIDNLLGSYRPTDPLAEHTGMSPAGTWRFTIIDHAGGSVGSIHHVSLWFELTVPAPGTALLLVGGLLLRCRKRLEHPRKVPQRPECSTNGTGAGDCGW